MLAWERAPVLPISRWFDPELSLPHPDKLDEPSLHKSLWDTIEKLYSQRIILDFTDPLSDQQLYCLIYRDILPSHEKKVELPKNYLHWHCLDDEDDFDTWLRFYATPDERNGWQTETGQIAPPAEPVPFPRQMPRRPQ